MRSRLGGVVLLLVGTVVVLSSPAQSATVTVVAFRFDAGTIGASVAPPANRGTATDLVTDVVRLNGGRLVVGASRTGVGRSLDFPARLDTEADRLAVLRVVDGDLTNGDALSPGTASFTFGADFRVDGGTRPDPGNNLLQRGLFGSTHQYKIQVDQINGTPRPECALGQMVDGAWVTVKATSPRAVAKATWYQVTCRRSGTTLVLSVFSFAADGTRALYARQRVTGIPAFDLTWPTEDPVVPMTIGGKLSPDGAFEADDDQFNGLVDNVFLKIG